VATVLMIFLRTNSCCSSRSRLCLKSGQWTVFSEL